MLERWNRRINLTALPLADYPALTLDRLLVEPIVASRFMSNTKGSWFDLGSGGGSPAIPLRLLRPKAALTMVEARERKTAFLREVVRQLELDRVAVLSSRIEQISPETEGSVDLVTVRALAPDESTIQCIRKMLKKGGKFLAFGWEMTELEGFSVSDEAPLPGGSTLRLFSKR